MNTINEFYVYMLLDPRHNNRPFYIGKGKKYRAQEHINQPNRGKNNIKINIINKIIKDGLKPILYYYEKNISENQAFLLEIELIKKYGKLVDGTGSLANLTNGGEGLSGYNFTDDHRTKIGLKHKNKKLSEETKNKLSLFRSGKTLEDIVGVEKAKTIKEKMSISRKGILSGQNNPMYGKKGILHPNYRKPGLRGNKNGMFDKTHTDDVKQKLRDFRIQEFNNRINNIDDNIKNLIIEDYVDNHEPLYRLKKKYGLSSKFISTILKNSNINIRKGNEKYKKVR